jgi:hypothetical protein
MVTNRAPIGYSGGNVNAASSLGMRAVHGRGDISEAIAELDALLGS